VSPKTGKLRLDAYMRTSKLDGRDGEDNLSRAEQEKTIRAYCDLDGHSIVHWHYEADQSGGDDTRPKWNEALERVESGETDGIIVAKLDRFARSAVDGLRAVTRIERAGGTFVSVAERFDTANAYGRFTMTIFFALAELELGRIKSGWRAAMESMVIENGVHGSGPAPAGYTRPERLRKGDKASRLELSEHAPAVLAAFECRAAGGSWTEVAQVLTDAGVPNRGARKGEPVAGKPWTWTSATKLVANRVYLGEARYGDIVRLDAHPVIVGRALWKRVRDRDGERPAGRSSSDGALLAKLLLCSVCGKSLIYSRGHSTARDRDYPVYRCRGHQTIAAAQVEGLMSDALRASLLVDQVTEQDVTPDIEAEDELRRKLDDAQTERAELLELAGGLSAATRVELLAAADERVEAALMALDQASARTYGAERALEPAEALAAWELVPVPAKRDLLRRMLDGVGWRVVVTPGHGDDRVRFEALT
jgi:site-specific DNA recombinase